MCYERVVLSGLGEILLVLLLVLLIFGTGSLPRIGALLGRTVKQFKRAAAENEKIQVAKIQPTSPTEKPQQPQSGEGSGKNRDSF